MSKREDYFINVPHNRITQKIQDRYLYNLNLEKSISGMLDDTGHINGQGRYPVSHMAFGWTNASNTACEAIAIYNVLHDIYEQEPLSKLIFYDEVLGYLLAFGYFGTKITKIGKFLDDLGVKYSKLSVKHFLRDADNEQFNDGDKFILCIKNRRILPISSIHTFEATIKKGKWIVYNRFNEDEKPRVYDSVEDILKNGKIVGKFLSLFKIEE